MGHTASCFSYPGVRMFWEPVASSSNVLFFFLLFQKITYSALAPGRWSQERGFCWSQLQGLCEVCTILLLSALEPCGGLAGAVVSFEFWILSFVSSCWIDSEGHEQPDVILKLTLTWAVGWSRQRTFPSLFFVMLWLVVPDCCVLHCTWLSGFWGLHFS